MNGGESHLKKDGHFQDEIQPFVLSDEDEKDHSAKNGLDSDRKLEEETEDLRASRPSSNWSRPQSKPNLVERLENEADLDEFEQREREILQQIEEERNHNPIDDDLEVIGIEDEYHPEPLEVITEEQEPQNESLKEEEESEVPPNFLQNRQLNADAHHQNSVEATFSDESDYPEGFPVEAISALPPAYSSNPTTTRDQSVQRRQIQVAEDLLKNEEDTFSSNSGPSGRKIEGLGSVVVHAGGIATALAQTIANTGSGQQLAVKMPRDQSPSSEELEDFDITTTNQRVDNQTEQPQNNVGSPTYKLSNDIKEMFHYVEEFTAERIDIRAVLRPFLLDYIPAVGDVDPFLKIPRPDQIDDQLGLVVLDEPAGVQSDPTIVDMKLRQLSNVVSKPADAPVKKLDRADKNQQHIDNWIKNIKELRRTRPPDRVAYSRQMPDLEKLMQEWPSEIDTYFQTVQAPTAKLDCSLEQYVDICLSLVDIPVHNKSRIHALHLLFSLYSEFKHSQHFRNLSSENEDTNDRLEL